MKDEETHYFETRFKKRELVMRNDIQPSLQTVEQYFSKSEFYIPSYQRPYAWQVAQCDQLFEDINQHMENFDKDSQDNYFFGAVLIAQESGEDHDVTLIDGQQRTTTFMLLLKASIRTYFRKIKLRIFILFLSIIQF